ncbi:MAG: efflux RND transporter periplasmic adaptor subunit [Candidatus Hydrogenedentes bacterium]|nr:efflux RND transporter periplasmic adaptor subunit [Candidatus Hydrogenedentota bacterium]
MFRGSPKDSHFVPLIAAPLCMAFLIGPALLLPGCRGEPDAAPAEVARPVKTMVVQPLAALLDRVFPARVRAEERADLSFRVPGQLAVLAVEAGQAVKAGDVLASLDTRDFENALADARSALAASEKDLEVLKSGSRTEDIAAMEAQLASAQARRNQADIDYQRSKASLDEGLISRSEFDRSATFRDVAIADVDRAAQALAKARAGARPEEVQAAEARTNSLRLRVEQAQSQLDDTQLRAPYDGVIAQVLADQFQEMQAKQPVLTIQTVGGLELVIDVPELLLQRTQRGMPMTLTATFPGRPNEEFPATFKGITTEADPQTQTYALTLRLNTPEGLVALPGMTAQVRIQSESPAGSLEPVRIPAAAVSGTEGGAAPYVWVIDADTSRCARREVRLGAISGDSVEILEGLNTGEVVATAGVSQLREGLPVRSMNQ